MKNSLRKFRDKKGLTQEALGKITGHDYRTISAYEHYSRPLPREFLAKAAAALEVTAEELESEPAVFLRDSAPDYQGKLNLAALSDAELQRLFLTQTEAYKAGSEDRQLVLLQSITALALELERRIKP